MSTVISTPTTEGTGFLGIPPPTAEVRRLYDDSRAQQGFVMNLSRLWAHQPALHGALFDLIGQAVEAARLTYRERAVLVVAGASGFQDAYCSLAWGNRLAGVADPELAGQLIRGDDDRLDPAERALARWARKVARDPDGTAPRDVEPLRAAGYDDAQIFALTTFVALRLAFATVNEALGAQPDQQLRAAAPAAVRDAITFGRLSGVPVSVDVDAG